MTQNQAAQATTPAQKSFNELKKMGAPVIARDDEGLFVISGEMNGDIIWADYYHEYPMTYLDDFGVHNNIGKVLTKHGLFAEWANPGYLNVHKI